MTFKTDWREVVKKAWSIRLMVLAGALSAAEVILPLFAESVPRGLFAALSGLAVGGGFVARLIAQKDIT